MSEHQVFYGSSERPHLQERVNNHFDTVIVCGMGPMELKANKKHSTNPVAANVFNTFNAVAAKLMVTKGWAERAIVSGFHSRKEARQNISPALAIQEQKTSEARLLADSYTRAHPNKGFHETPSYGRESYRENLHQRINKADENVVLDEEATTTFRNIIEGINQEDAKAPGGHFDGTFGVISPRFHGPRVNEMLKAFGLENGKFLVAEGILDKAGYHGNETRGFGPTYDTFNKNAYPSQPAGLQNLQENPSYVTKELAAIKSDRRLQEIASSLKRYYTVRPRPVPLPEVYSQLPEHYEPDFDYGKLKESFGAVEFTKNPYDGDLGSAILQYQRDARALDFKTKRILT